MYLNLGPKMLYDLGIVGVEFRKIIFIFETNTLEFV